MKEQPLPTPPLVIDPKGRYLIPEQNRTAILDTHSQITIRCEDAWSAYHAMCAIVGHA